MTRQEKGRKLISKAQKMMRRAKKIIAEGNKLEAKALVIWEQGWSMKNGEKQPTKRDR